MTCAGAVLTSSMLVSLLAMRDCSVHWAGAMSMLVIAVSFCGVQLGAGQASHENINYTGIYHIIFSPKISVKKREWVLKEN